MRPSEIVSLAIVNSVVGACSSGLTVLFFVKNFHKQYVSNKNTVMPFVFVPFSFDLLKNITTKLDFTGLVKIVKKLQSFSRGLFYLVLLSKVHIQKLLAKSLVHSGCFSHDSA